MISLQKITLLRAQKVLLENIDLIIYAKQRLGLIGDNGCGKSTFFAMLQSRIEPTQGTISLPKQLEIAEVKQEIPSSLQPAIDYVIDGDKRYRALQALLQQAEKKPDPNLLAKCHDELASIDGYAIEGKAEKILRGLGFASEELQNPTQDFSGGWRMRLNLAQALMSRADLLLLDEPTNHLDLDAIIWLEKWLLGFNGTLLVVSHDREFLDNTVNGILLFEQKKLHLYTGNYSSFEKQQAMQVNIQQAAYEKQQAQIAHMKKFIDRFRAKATKARQAQSRLKALEKMELVAAVQTESTFRFSFKKPKDCPNPLLRIENAVVSYYQGKPVLQNINLQIAPADRLGLLGANGAGKSTLIKLLAGTLQPTSGLIHFYKGIKIGYFAQHQIEHLNLQRSPLQLLQELAPNQNQQALRTFLGSFNFSGEMATTPVENFSGGEKSRLALALIVWQAPNLLLLDEPTNHLDMKMREALALALQDYSGALILVSHDRHLVRITTDELRIVADQKIEKFKGDLDDYRKHLLERTSPKRLSGEWQEKKNPGKEKRKLETELNQLEKKLQQLQSQKQELDSLLADPKTFRKEQSQQLKEYHQQQQALTQKIHQIEADWLVLLEQLE
jgi:ATP-binding cassette, subfamily F, member 3